MSRVNLLLGKKAEESAAIFLKENGYRVLARNYRTRLGEIDIIALDQGTYCFIEVKARSSERFGLPQEALLRRKQRQISKAALIYLKENNLLEKRARFDVVSLIYQEGVPKLDLIKNAFELDSSFTY